MTQGVVDHKISLRAGVIGLGVGERHILGFQSDSRCQVVALCDLNRERLHEVAARHPGKSLTTSSDELLADPGIDVVSIATYDDSHRDLVISALENGKHVFVEKPLCLTRPDLTNIADALQKYKGLRLSSNLVLRSVPRFLDLRKRIFRGDLGKVYFVEGDYDYGRLEKLVEGWRGRISNYSVVHGGAIHLIDMLLWLTGETVEEVFAYGNDLATRESRFSGIDMVISLLKFTNGQVAKISSNFASVTPHHHNLSVYGTAGTFTQGHTGAAYMWSRDREAVLEKVGASYPGNRKGEILTSFVRSILDGTPAAVTSREVFRATDVSLAITESLASGRPITLGHEGWWDS